MKASSKPPTSPSSPTGTPRSAPTAPSPVRCADAIELNGITEGGLFGLITYCLGVNGADANTVELLACCSMALMNAF